MRFWFLDAQQRIVALILRSAPCELSELQGNKRNIGRTEARFRKRPLATINIHRDRAKQPHRICRRKAEPCVDVMQSSGEIEDT